MSRNVTIMATHAPDVIVIGAGIVGAACADALAAAGLSVLVLEAGVVGGGASAAGMGHVVVMDDSGPQLALTRYSRGLWDALLPDLPPDCEAQPSGFSVTVKLNPMDAAMSMMPAIVD